MKIVFVSNYFSHHQRPLCDALAALTEFSFLESEKMPAERLTQGWQVEKPAYVTEDRTVLREADVVIAGSAPESWILPCVWKGKLVFRYHERPLKDGNPVRKRLPRWIKWHLCNPGKRVWLLCAGSKVASDYAKFGLFRQRALKWGYFPETSESAEKVAGRVLWVGRLLELKHPCLAVRAVAALREEGFDLRLKIVGDGPEKEHVLKTIRAEKLEDCVTLTGFLPAPQARQEMAEAEIFLFTSDQREGWGAVLNEAMAMGCAVVASQEAGASEYLVQDGQNGLTYQTQEQLVAQLRRLLTDGALRQRLGSAAQQTVADSWNGREAAQRLVAIAQDILEGNNPQLWPDGPCSRG